MSDLANDLTLLSLAELRAGLDGKKFSSRELSSACLQKAQGSGSLGSFITIDEKQVLAAADAADKELAGGRRLPLLGIPIAVKDVILTKDLLTTCASKILHNFIPPYDATVVSLVKQAGGIVLGKTNMDEFAMGSSNENSHFGAVKNPWKTDCVPGGSSGGSAVAVATHCAPVSLGTDTGGSIRQPASFCSVVGLKPTYGRVSRYGVIAFASSLDQVGCFARNVSDCAVATQILCKHDPLDSTSVAKEDLNPARAFSQDVKGLRIGVPKEYFIKGLNAEVESSVRAALAHLEKMGARIVEVTLPHTEAAVAVYYVLAPAEASSNLARFDGIRYGYRAENTEDLKDLYSRSRSEGFGKEVKRRIIIGTYVLSSGYYDAFYLRAQKVRTLIAQDFRNAFEQHCDVIAAPAAPTTAFKIGEKTANPLEMYLNDVFTIPVNLAGLPGMTIPCGFDAGGLPIGLQLIGKAWDEEMLFRVSHAFESTTDWHKRRAPNH